MPLFRVASNTTFLDEGGNNQVAATVFVSAMNELEVKFKATEKFRGCICDHQQDDDAFDNLQKMSPEQREDAYENDATLRSLFRAAIGEFTIVKVEDGVSSVEFVC